MIYKECCVIPCHAGFAEYQLGECNGEVYYDLDILVDAMIDGSQADMQVIEPGDAKDIRDNTHVPGYIHKLLYDGERYFAIVAFEEVEADA